MINDPPRFIIILFRLLALPFFMVLLALAYARGFIITTIQYIRYGGEALVYSKRTKTTVADILETFEDISK